MREFHNPPVGDTCVSGVCATGLRDNQASALAWYCGRTKPKQERLAAANLRAHWHLEVFHPQMRSKRATVRGPVRIVEALFPGYVFVRCVLNDDLMNIRHTTGISSLVHFGERIPAVPDELVDELRAEFGEDELIDCQEPMAPGKMVRIATGAMAGMEATVLRVLSGGQRVQLLLEFLGRPTPVEVPRHSLVIPDFALADRLPQLALAR